MSRKYILILGFYLLIAIAILWKLLLPGYIPLHVSNFTPNYIPGNYFDLFNLFNLARYLLTLILPAWVGQKILLIGLIVLTGLTMHFTLPVKETSIKFLGGLFYVVNPFFHTRLMIGHLHIIAGYALLPLAFYALRKFKLNDKKSWLLLIIAGFLLSNLSIHMAYIFACFTGLMSLFLILKKQWKKAFISLACVLLGSALNLQHFFNQTHSVANAFTRADYEGFLTAADPVYGVLINILGLYGYHLEPLLQTDGLLFTKQILFFWPIFVLIFLFVSFLGIRAFWKQEKVFSRTAIVFLILSIIIAIGSSSSLTSPIYEFLWEYAPFFKGFREPQKWVSFIVFFISFFGSLGVAHSINKIQKKSNRQIFLIFSFFMIILYNLTFFGGYFGRLKTFWYPESWQEIKALISEEQNTKALFLPWHLYLDFDFTNYHYISNPAQQYFHPITVIQGDNIESSTIYSGSSRPVSKAIENFLERPTKKKLNSLSQNFDLQWIIYYDDLVEGERYDYRFLENMADLSLIYNKNKSYLYKISP